MLSYHHVTINRFGAEKCCVQNENDNALYCGGFGVQHQQNGGRCGICGDPWDAWPRQNEAPHGIYATGIIGKTYRQVGEVITTKYTLLFEC